MSQLGFRYGDNHFPLYVGDDGRYYAYDPHGHLPGPHGELPGATSETIETAIDMHGGLAGLGTSTAGSAVETIVPAALSFVPVVGPILAAVAAFAAPIIGGMFGGNDPTPMATLTNKIIQLRTLMVQANTSLGIPDHVPALPAGKSYAHMYDDIAIVLEAFPANANIQDNNHWVCDWTGVHCPGCGRWRRCQYATINKLAAQAQALTNQAQTAAIHGGLQPGAPGYVPPVSPYQSPSSGGGATAPGGYYPSDYASGYSDPNAPVPAGSQASIASMGTGLTYLPLLLIGAAVLFSAKGQSPRRQYAPRR